MKHWTRPIVCTVFALTAAASSLAGPLNPPAGPVSPTFKTLSEVEPRIAVNAVNTPGNAAATFRITASGSYYLTGDVIGQAGKHGIEIAASCVTLDLNGCTLHGVGGSHSGINMSGFARNVVIRNGHVRGWGQSGISAKIDAGRIEGITAASNLQWGIDNHGGGTFMSHIIGCEAYVNGTAGSADSGNIRGGARAVISRCISHGARGYGIAAHEASIIERCIVSSTQGSGIVAESSARIVACTSWGNSGSGIEVVNDCIVLDSLCDQNAGAGILVAGTDNRVEGNQCTDNGKGLDVDGTGNFIARNTCSGNALNWEVAAGNACLVVQAVPSPPISGNSGGISPGSNDPNANFTY